MLPKQSIDLRKKNKSIKIGKVGRIKTSKMHKTKRAEENFNENEREEASYLPVEIILPQISETACNRAEFFCAGFDVSIAWMPPNCCKISNPWSGS